MKWDFVRGKGENSLKTAMKKAALKCMIEWVRHKFLRIASEKKRRERHLQSSFSESGFNQHPGYALAQTHILYVRQTLFYCISLVLNDALK